MQAVSSNSPLILSFVSGKGGVGKTMLAVSAANELAQLHRTLIIDLDFFNRGLSGMFIRSAAYKEVRPPSFAKSNHVKDWTARTITPNLFTISFPDIGHLEQEVHTPEYISLLADHLLDWILELSSELECTVVVLDCHGGPDALSFASTMISDKTILVSEPDRVTMYGTLHFLRRLDQLEVTKTDVYLVFNKVVDSVGSNFLWRLYDETLRNEYFDGRPLLAAYPIELYLAKSFENNPLATEDYPQSMLALKTQVMLFDLIHEDTRTFLSERAESVPIWLKFLRRRFFWRRPKLFSLDFLAAVGFVLLLIAIGLSWLDSTYGARLEDHGWISWRDTWARGVKPDGHKRWLVEDLRVRKQLVEDVINIFTKTIMAWAAFAATALVLSWTRYLDRQANFLVRNRGYVSSGFYMFMMMCLWGFVIYFLSSTTKGYVDRSIVGLNDIQKFMVIVVIATLFVVVGIWIAQAYRSYREVKYAKRLFVGVSRSICATLVVLTPVMFFISDFVLE